MRARIHKPGFRLEFDGEPRVWNDLLRPLVGGPEAPPDPAPAPAPQAPPQPAAAATASPPGPALGAWTPHLADESRAPGVRTWKPPRDERRPEHAPRRERPATPDEGRPAWRRRGGPEPERKVEPSNDARTLYARLGEVESRRAEKDAVVAAVWFLGADTREVHEKEVEKHLADNGGPVGVKLRPLFLKHITRTKYFEAGSAPGFVRLSRKGREQVRLLCGV